LSQFLTCFGKNVGRTPIPGGIALASLSHSLSRVKISGHSTP